MNVVLLAFLWAVAGADEPGILSQGVHPPPAEVAPTQSEQPEREQSPAQTLAQKIAFMSLRQRVCQLMMVTLQGWPKPDTMDITLLSDHTPGSVIVPRMLRPGDGADYVSRLRVAAREQTSGIPLLIGANLYELPMWGWGPKDYFVPLPSLLSIAATGDPGAAERLADLLAKHLTAMGFDMHLGPTLELAPKLPGAKGSIQCFGGNPEFVAAAGAAMLKGLTDAGVVAVAMGFPGGGMNRTGKEPAVLLTPAAHFNDADLLPYKRAVEGGALMIHVGNTLAPTLDTSGLPASLSPAVISGVLRNTLGFGGVIVAGPMDTNDIARAYSPDHAALLAIKAGADMVCWASGGTMVMRSVERIVRSVESGDLSEGVLNAAVGRVLALKFGRGLAERKALNARTAGRLELNRRFSEEALAIERRAVVLVQNRNKTLPLIKGESTPVRITGVAGVEELHAALAKPLKHVDLQPIVSAKHGRQIFDFEVDRVTSRIGGIRTVVCLLTSDLRGPGTQDLLRQVRGAGARVVVVLIGLPDALPDFGEADAILVSHCDPKACDLAMKAVADALLGQGPPTIASSVGDLHTQVGKPETFKVSDVVRSPAGRLPVDIQAPFLAGFSLHYAAAPNVKKATWDFGDGRRATGLEVTKAYEAAGRYAVTLTVSDKNKETVSRTFYVVVE